MQAAQKRRAIALLPRSAFCLPTRTARRGKFFLTARAALISFVARGPLSSRCRSMDQESTRHGLCAAGSHAVTCLEIHLCRLAHRTAGARSSLSAHDIAALPIKPRSRRITASSHIIQERGRSSWLKEARGRLMSIFRNKILPLEA